MRPILLLLAGCGVPATQPVTTCAALMRGEAISDADTLAATVPRVQALYPSLEGVAITLATLDSATDFFQADVEPSTLTEPPRDRVYRVRHAPRIFDDPPPRSALVAILAHELGHVDDYVGMETSELVDFALWYATTDDIAPYERATDEKALELGCGEGLAAYRTWLYDHVDPETAAQKRLDYYTPEEIAAWEEASR